MTRLAPPRDIMASVLLIVSGCVIASLGDFTFELTGCVGCSKVRSLHLCCCRTSCKPIPVSCNILQQPIFLSPSDSWHAAWCECVAAQRPGMGR